MFRSILTSARSGALVLSLLALTAGVAHAQEASPVGDWEGTIAAGAQEVPLAFHVTQAEDGTLSATLDSPAQGAFGVPLESVEFTDGVLTFALAAASASYEGTLSEDGTSLMGTWSQMGQSAELNMVKGDS